MKPIISVLVCTYNSAQMLNSCLDSILRQDLPHFEILCIDGMSHDGTRALIGDYGTKDQRVRLISNERRLPEGRGFGKWLGARAARGDYLAIIDQDNVLQRLDLFASAVRLLEQRPELLGVLGGLKNDHADAPVVRFVSLFGTDAFFAYRSVDFLRTVEREVRQAEHDGISYELIPMTGGVLPLTGGNCFIYRRSDIEAVGGYDQDVLVVNRLVQRGKNEVAVLPDATKHHAEASLRRLAVKKFFWGRKYFVTPAERFNYWPSTHEERRFFLQNLLFNLTVVPNFYYSWRAYRKSADWVAYLFPWLAFLNTIAYGWNAFFGAVTSSSRNALSSDQTIERANESRKRDDPNGTSE